MLKSFIIAFSMYSRIPMPHMDWQEEDMGYVLSFFPFVGGVIGAVECMWIIWGGHIFQPVSVSAVAVAVPVIISGGIHLDGFMDTSDALSSYGSREKRLAILKDPHVGAFAIIHAIILVTIYFGAIYELVSQSIAGNAAPCLLLGLGYMLSRILSGLSAMIINPAGNGGTLETLKRSSKRLGVICMLFVEFVMVAAGMILVSLREGLIMLCVSAAMLLAYRHMAVKDFGGVTGDTAGWYLCVMECAYAICLAMAGHL